MGDSYNDTKTSHLIIFLFLDLYMHSEIKKWGNSLALIIPAEKAKDLELEEGEAVDVEIKKCQRIDAFGVFSGSKTFKRDEKEHEDLW